jgi:hypothetical protein
MLFFLQPSSAFCNLFAWQVCARFAVFDRACAKMVGAGVGAHQFFAIALL